MIKKLVFFLFSFAFLMFGRCDVLLWQIDPYKNIDGSPSLNYFLTANHNDDDIGVRIAVYSEDGNFVEYMNPIPYDGYNDEYLGVVSGIEWWQVQARQAEFTGDSAGKLFMMEIGNYVGDDYEFNPIAYSGAESMDGKHTYEPGSILPSPTDWIPSEFYTIKPVIPSGQMPEPSTAVLFLIGISLIGIRRPSFK